mmetsp:Transcript_20087/g.33836  ORF Transcript_20087/g.33836 Transcript_20087/m.33836 type:complete len:200 (-) Transcript_20087:371-970(-)
MDTSAGREPASSWAWRIPFRFSLVVCMPSAPPLPPELKSAAPRVASLNPDCWLMVSSTQQQQQSSIKVGGVEHSCRGYRDTHHECTPNASSLSSSSAQAESESFWLSTMLAITRNTTSAPSQSHCSNTSLLSPPSEPVPTVAATADRSSSTTPTPRYCTAACRSTPLSAPATGSFLRTTRVPVFFWKVGVAMFFLSLCL